MKTRNGWVDNGQPIRGSRTKCPNCGSTNFVESLSAESCNACGLHCDYWGEGANAVYEGMMARREAEEKRRLDEQDRQEVDRQRRLDEQDRLDGVY